MQYSNIKLLSTLHQQQETTIRDPLWKDIKFSRAFKAILLTPAVQKLGRIKQLGPTFHLYPGAVHTRLDHSLGVYHLGYSILKSLCNQDQYLPITEEGALTFLCACLLHDIGHFPFAHSLKELPLTSHEEIACKMVQEDAQLSKAIKESGLDPWRVGAIIDEHEKTEEEELLLYRSILSGTLDPDKLDYLNRDAFFCGVPYGTQDVSYIVDRLTIAKDRLALREEALGSVEHLLFSKYLMYRNVYWHTTTRCATAMIKKAILSSLAAGTLQAENLYGLDDEQFFALPQKRHITYSNLFSLVRNNQLYTATFEKPYEADGILETQNKDLAKRLSFEESLAERLGCAPSEIIVDIPEPISFEADLPILHGDGTLSAFGEVDYLFSSDIGKVFTKSLRKFRIFTPPTLSAYALRKALEF
ncbi:MAG: HD domain-containing protein [Sphaerochaetaceae bacterium]